ncbi:nitroreductase [Granulicella aggregans]|uniref:Nitroreductase n=1 Tax=Granulicella aggregans TaxID=474949 RepID=A0A7W8E2S9_9BACT|nr:nitroreductase family protein [Granulicella aggregans]MBB5056509.1 nitroreductase [Granulicella aggregans]
MDNLEALKHAPAELGIHDLIASRWSPRAFSDKAVSADDLTKIFTAASWAASSTNEQPWRFLVGRKGDETFAKILESLVAFNQTWAGKAPVLVLSAGKKTFSPGPYGGGANDYALHDTGAASATMSLQAMALGLHTHGMGGFDKEKARAHFGIPEDFEIGAVWALGYLGEPDSLSEVLKGRELAERTRKPVGEFVFSEWDVAAKF